MRVYWTCEQCAIETLINNRLVRERLFNHLNKQFLSDKTGDIFIHLSFYLLFRFVEQKPLLEYPPSTTMSFNFLYDISLWRYFAGTMYQRDIEGKR